jgi:hypothetical protein
LLGVRSCKDHAAPGLPRCYRLGYGHDAAYDGVFVGRADTFRAFYRPSADRGIYPCFIVLREGDASVKRFRPDLNAHLDIIELFGSR